MAEFKSSDLRNVYCSPNLIQFYETHSHSFTIFFSACIQIFKHQDHLKNWRLQGTKAQSMSQTLFSNYLVIQESI